MFFFLKVSYAQQGCINQKYSKTVLIWNIQPLAKMMESPHLDDVPKFFTL